MDFHAVSERIRRKGGATVSLAGERPSGTMVSSYGAEETVKGTAKPEHLQDYVSRHEALLKQPGYYLGAWKHGGETFLDVSQNFNDRRAANDFAKKNAQRAVYDLDAVQERRVRYEPRMSPQGTLFEGHRKEHAAYSRFVSETHRRQVEFDLQRAQMAAQSKVKAPAPTAPQGEQMRLF